MRSTMFLSSHASPHQTHTRLTTTPFPFAWSSHAGGKQQQGRACVSRKTRQAPWPAETCRVRMTRSSSNPGSHFIALREVILPPLAVRQPVRFSATSTRARGGPPCAKLPGPSEQHEPSQPAPFDAMRATAGSSSRLTLFSRPCPYRRLGGAGCRRGAEQDNPFLLPCSRCRQIKEYSHKPAPCRERALTVVLSPLLFILRACCNLALSSSSIPSVLPCLACAVCAARRLVAVSSPPLLRPLLPPLPCTRAFRTEKQRAASHRGVSK